MKRLSIVFGALLLSAIFVFGQTETANYAGTWTLNLTKSELGERARIKSMTMTVTQTEAELSYVRAAEREEGGGGFGGQGGGGSRMGGGMFGGNQSATFSLDGKETSVSGDMGSSKLKAKAQKGLLKLTQERNFETQMGSMKLTATEKWTLSEDGKTLTVDSETATPRGARVSKMVFTKNQE